MELAQDRDRWRALVDIGHVLACLGLHAHRSHTYIPNVIFFNNDIPFVVGTGWSWLRIGTGGAHLWVR